MPTIPQGLIDLGYTNPDQAEIDAYLANNPQQNVGGAAPAPTTEATPSTAYKAINYATLSRDDKNAERQQQSMLRNAQNIVNQKVLSPEQQYRQTLKKFQTEIDATNKVYAQILADTKQQGLGNLGSSRAIQARSGLLGSDFGASQTSKVNTQNTEAENLVRAEQSAKIQAIIGKARTDAVAELAEKRAAQKQGAQDYLDYLASATERKTNKLASVASLFLDQGVTIEEVDPAQLKKIAKEYGLSVEEIKQGYSSEKKARDAAQAEADAKAIKDNSFTLNEGEDYYRFNPKTGKNELIASKAKTYAPKTGGTSTGTGGIYDMLDYRTANAVISQGNNFSQNPIVTKYNNLVAAGNLINGVDKNTQNPADHQAIVYNFAKALDPDSVVREGEYATIKKYSQGLASKYAGEIKQAVSGTGFLSPDAISAIQKATQNRVASYQPQYDNLKKSTANRINTIAGQDVADIVLLDFESGYTQPSTGKSIEDYQAEFPGASIEELQALMQEEGN